MRPMSKRRLESLTKGIAKSLEEDEERRKLEEEERYKTKEVFVQKCHCSGDVILRTSYSQQYNPASGPMIIGPGSKNQFSMIKHEKSYCSECGLLYDVEIVKKKVSI